MRLGFSLMVRGQLLGVQITHEGTTYALRRGEVLHLWHDGEPVQVKAGEPVTLPTTAPPARSGAASRPAASPPGGRRRRAWSAASSGSRTTWRRSSRADRSPVRARSGCGAGPAVGGCRCPAAAGGR